MIGKHHQLNGREFDQTLGDSEGQENLVSYSPCGCKESDKTEQQQLENLDFIYWIFCYHFLLHLSYGIKIALEFFPTFGVINL